MAGSSRLSGPQRDYYDRRGRKLKVLNADSRFSFACDQCGRCCHGADIPLNPYDILKISDHYGITTREFLEEFTRWAVASPSGIPVVFLKTTPSCPFNREGLCNVYQVRPFLCRSYPVIRIVTHNPSTGGIKIKYSLEKNCSTVKANETRTIRDWLAEQCGEICLQESLKWSEFKVRLAGGEYPGEDKVFHHLFYDIIYASQMPEDEMKAMGISKISSPEERFEAILRFASGVNWTQATEEAKATGALLRMERSAGLVLPG
ncbi:YkgJ family cysteine cluster protein [Candidatus Poribacteria bacterium]